MRESFSANHKATRVPRAAVPRQLSTPLSSGVIARSACACGGTCPRCNAKTQGQPKLNTTQPGDAMEREADAMADRMLSAPHSAADIGGGSKTRSATVARSASSNAASAPSPAIAEAMQETGEPLDGGTRDFFEPRLGRDLGDVRVHTGAAARASARAMSAHAYTFGQNIVFGANEYRPHESSGRRLLAHELAHVAQQDGAPSIARMVMRQSYSGCDAATAGVADANDRITAVHQRAMDVVMDARVRVATIDKPTLAMLDRHFHCPSVDQVEKIGENLQKMANKVLTLSPACIDAQHAVCQQGRNGALDPAFSVLNGLNICPSAFAGDDADISLLRVFLDAAARLSGLSPNCVITDACYGDASVGAGSMVTNIDSYVAFAIEMSGHTFAPVASVACGGDTDERLREIKRKQTPVDPNDPCSYDACADRHGDIRADLTRAVTQTGKSITALTGEPNENAVRALDWYFNDHGQTTIATVRERLGCIKAALQDTLDNDRYGCASRAGAYAFVLSNGAVCEDTLARVCLDFSYFGMSPRSRVATLVHECGHRVGLSVSDSGMDDVYSHETRFLNLDTSESLLNTESYGHFVNAIVNGVPVTLRYQPFGGTIGKTTKGDDFYQFYTGLEAEHPSLLFFNPSLGVAITGLVHADEEDGSVKPAADAFVSLLGGVRIADPRPGKYGGGYLSIRGGPTLALNIDNKPSDNAAEWGAEANVSAGWRWRWLDVGVTGGAMYDPMRNDGDRAVFYGGVSISILPVLKFIPGIE